MAEFDPDAFIASQQGSADPKAGKDTTASGFDPDAFIQAQQGSPPSQEDFDPDKFISDNGGEQPQTTDRESLGQEAMSFVEGMGRPLGGDAAMHYLHNVGGDSIAPSDEDVAARRQANPGIAGAGEFVGNIAGMKGLGAVLPKFAALGKIGSAALRSGIEMATLQGGQELSNHFSMPPADESGSDALAHMGYAGLLGAATGGTFGVLEQGMNSGLKALDKAGLIDRGGSFLAGLGAAAEGTGKPVYDPFIKEFKGLDTGIDLDKSAWDAGHKLHTELPDKIAKYAVDAGTAGVGLQTGGVYGLLASHYINPYVEKILQKPLSMAARKTVMPLINKALTSNAVQALPAALKYGESSAKGAKALAHGLNMVFNSGVSTAYNSDIDPKQRQDIQDGIDGSILDQQMQNQQSMDTQPQTPGYAEGGSVQPRPENKDHFADLMPAENTILQSARSRVYNYLKSAKPQQQPGLAFDKKQTTKTSQRKYDSALDLATNPLSILSHVKKGTVTAENVGHMTQMWPELSNHLAKRITERITQNQLNGEKPSYKIRQGLSMLMGQPLESVMTQPSIAAAQMAFKPKAPNTPAQGQGKLQRGTSKLGSKTNNMYKTQSEAAESDRTSRE